MDSTAQTKLVSSIPRELRDLNRWVVWRYEQRNGDKPTKIPYQVTGHGRAQSNNPDTWGTFEQALQQWHHGYDGIGFMFASDDAYVGIDLDNCRNPETGTLAPWAREIVADCATYAEVSPSGCGIKLFGRTCKPVDRGRKVPVPDVSSDGGTPAVEIYDRGRYFTVTGWRDGEHTTVADCTDAVGRLLQKLDGWKNAKQGKPQPSSQRQSTSTTSSGAIDRARKYIATMPSAISGQGGHNATFSVACVCFRFGLSDGDAWQLLDEYNQRCEPPWSEAELQHKLESARDTVTAAGEIGSMPDREHQQDNGEQVDFDALLNGQTSKPKIVPIAARELIEQHPELHEPIIHGLLRRGETANIIAAPKVGKSWLVYGLALSVASGQKWLDQFGCEPGRVLLIDNELHRPTLASRLRHVADHLLTPFDDSWPEHVDILSLRGRLENLHGIAALLADIPSDAYDLVVLDAFYRSVPSGTSENDNAGIANLFNLIDQLAARLNCAWVNIHHSSKGSQTEKSVTDVGAGAGSQSRAADAHIVLREHEDEGAVVLDAAVRSFPPIQPVPLRFRFPLWQVDLNLDPKMLRGRLTRGEQRQQDRDQEAMDNVLAKLVDGPLTAKGVRERTGFGKPKADRILDKLLAAGKVTCEEVKIQGGLGRKYSLPNPIK